MLLLPLVFGPCILNAITHFISSQMEAKNLQLLEMQYRPWDKRNLMEFLKFSVDACSQVEKASQRGK
jgi:hypothetical protein